MASLFEISELAYRQLFPNPSDETALDVQDFITTARSLYATQMWVFARNEKNTEGVFNVPSFLLTEVVKDVVDNKIDISDLTILKSLPSEVWLQGIDPFGDCKYIKTNVNQMQLLNEDDSTGDIKTYVVIGNQIRFPKGTHKKKLSLIYANSGESVDEDMYIDDAISGVIRDKLIETYGGKIGKEDVTNNSSSLN